MKTKQRMRLEIKEISDEGSFEGLLSPYGNVDGGGDVVEKGAYTKTLQDHGATRPMLWQHKSDVPVGELTLEDRPDGLWCKGQLLMSLPEAQKAYLLVKARIVKGLSIGFEAVKDSVVNGVRHLNEIRLYEGSVVTFPMNEHALITSVKARGKETKGDFNEELNEIQLSDAGYQMRNALSTALSSLIWSGLKKDEIVTASETIIQQFSDAYMAYIPAYIDMLAEYYGDLETWAKKHLETKAGRTISAATKKTLTEAQEHMTKAHEHTKSANDLLSALISPEADDTDCEAGDDTSEGKAAALKTEPESHSAAQTLISEIRSLIPAA
jgi:HK97 family phage prohead protease